MSHIEAVKALFDEWAQEDGAVEMSRGHWPRTRQVLSDIRPSSGAYLEVGPGNGSTLRHMATTSFAKGRCHGVDVSQGMIACARRTVADLTNVELVAADFRTWAVPRTLRFDLIFSMEVFYYFQDVAGAIRKAAALLAPQGELIVMVDYFAENPASHDWPEELSLPLVLWSQTDYAAAFEAAGLVDVAQAVIADDHREPAVSLCTRGRRAPDAPGLDDHRPRRR